MTRTFLPHVITDDSALGGLEIERSFRFNDNDNAYLFRTPSSAGNRKTWTLSVWVKRTVIDTNQRIFTAYDGSNINAECNIQFQSDGKIQINNNNTSSNTDTNLKTDRLFRDPSAWYHIVIGTDMTQGTASDRVNLYINGVQETSFSTESYGTQNVDWWFNNNSLQTIGRRHNTTERPFDGYMAEFNFIDGQQLTPSSFGFTESQTGIWKPKRYKGTYGTNGFRLDFSDNSSITNMVKDKSGNGNNFSPDNCNTEDSMLDTPTNNFPTMNPLTNYSGLSQGNLRFNNYNDSAGNRSTQATIALPKSGKWYWEARYSESTGQISTKYFGVSQAQMNTGYLTAPYVYYDRTLIANGNSSENISHGQDWYNGVGVPAILGCAVNVDNNTVSFYHNNTLQGTITLPTLTPLQEYFFTWANTSGGSSSSLNDTFNFGADSTFQGQVSRGNNTDANGIGDFKYAVPSGHLALCSKNISPKNVPSIIRPQRHFETLIYTGDGTATRSISGLEFKPDFIWIKNRGQTDWHIWGDSVRGFPQTIYSNRAEAEVNGAGSGEHGHIASAHDHGFIVKDDDGTVGGNCNANSETYVAWCWKGGGTAVSNSDGTITSSVSANTEAGFSIVTWTGSGADASVGHGLGKKPHVIFVKNRSASDNWRVWWKNVTTSDAHALVLNDTTAVYTGSDKWYNSPNSNDTTTTTFGVSNDGSTNRSGESFVGYCWAEIPGYSKFGTYTGNGSSDGTYVHLDFRPAWVMVKRTSGTQNWRIFDNKRNTFNDVDLNLQANSNGAEFESSAYNALDFLSNGFKLRGTNADEGTNQNGQTYAYMAFAEEPGTTSFDTFPNAR